MKNRSALAIVALLAAAAVSSPGTAAGQQAQQSQPQQQQQQQQQQAKQSQSDYQTTDKFKDMSIKSAQGKEVGTVDKVVVDMKTGQLAYFILARGGVGGMGKEKYIVPWNAMTPDPKGKGMVLQVPREKLRLAPAGDDVEKQLTRQMGEEIARHYGVAPYWESAGGQQQQQQPEPQQQPQTQPQPQPSPAQQTQPGQPQQQSPQSRQQ